ncbi:hypothetical protein [Mycobacterium sp. HNNTM2301]|uniref:hypothetical protein n=1 Tax=Mycobacterium hainanense TaxID=3289775 RepID=UPI0035A5948F
MSCTNGTQDANTVVPSVHGIRSDLASDVEHGRHRYLTPLSADDVARAVVTAVRRGKRRLVLPPIVTVLLVTEAVSSSLGDLIITLLARNRWFGQAMGLSRGRTYHQAISSISTEGDRRAIVA